MDTFNSITCPAEGDKILTHYHGYYDTVFIIFHPFIKPKKGFDFDFENACPEKTTVVEYFHKIQWSEMLKECAFENYNRLDIALRN